MTDNTVVPKALTAETASEYDFILAIDASGSMGERSTRFAGMTRWDEMKETAVGISRELEAYDDDGLTLIVFGGSVSVHDGVKTDALAELFKTRAPRGTTPLTEAIEQIAIKAAASKKKTVALIFTDGAPNDAASAANTIAKIANGLDSDDQVSLQFIQIGNDEGATRFLKFLDDNLKAKFDIVDTIPVPEAETLSALELVTKAIND